MRPPRSGIERLQDSLCKPPDQNHAQGHTQTTDQQVGETNEASPRSGCRRSPLGSRPTRTSNRNSEGNSRRRWVGGTVSSMSSRSPFTSRHSPRSTEGNQVVAALPELANRSASPNTNLPFGERRSKCAARGHLHVLDWRRRPTFRSSHRYSARRDLLTVSNLGIWESPELGGSIIAVPDPPHSRPSARSRQAIASRAA